MTDSKDDFAKNWGSIVTNARICLCKTVQFVVKDSGIGIPAEELPRIFDRFYRIYKSRARSISGTGLGLAIVKHLLDALGGTIEVESRPHHGTTFRFRLPVSVPDPSAD